MSEHGSFSRVPRGEARFIIPRQSFLLPDGREIFYESDKVPGLLRSLSTSPDHLVPKEELVTRIYGDDIQRGGMTPEDANIGLRNLIARVNKTQLIDTAYSIRGVSGKSPNGKKQSGYYLSEQKPEHSEPAKGKGVLFSDVCNALGLGGVDVARKLRPTDVVHDRRSGGTYVSIDALRRAFPDKEW